MPTPPAEEALPAAIPALDAALEALAASKDAWLRTGTDERIALLQEVKRALLPISAAWVEAAAWHKGIRPGSPLEGEEWLSGPYTVMNYCNQMMATLARVKGRRHLEGIPLRELASRRLAARVLPHSAWDYLLLSGVTAEVWMQEHITRENLAAHTACAYHHGEGGRTDGKLALVLGAGNIAAIAPLDALHKLYAENQVVLLKLNPVNDYLGEFLRTALRPLIDRKLLAIVQGDARVGQYLSNHPLVDEIHITGSGASHDAIVWGTGSEGVTNKLAGRPKNRRRITSELGAVCPTIVVPGAWSQADIRFQAEQVATQKMHNAGFNCVACQVLVMPRSWPQKVAFLQALRDTLSATEARRMYYPGTDARLDAFASSTSRGQQLAHQTRILLADIDANAQTEAQSTEVFGPALGVVEIDDPTAELYLRKAIAYANDSLYGSLGANIVIHPRSIKAMGDTRFEELLADLRYGTIAINAWTGLGFLTPQATWGAFPGHTLKNVQSGIGVVHNTLLFDKPERTVVRAPFRPFPRSLLGGSFSLLPKPPWFITNRRAHVLGRLLVDFQYRPSLLKIPRILWNALRG